MNTTISGRVGALIATAVLVASIAAAPTFAQDVEQPKDASDIWDISRGGELYDKWWAVTEVDPPKETHPAYPADARKSGPATWRCKECHGWDLKGADGAYSSGSHRTGIKGLQAMQGAPVADIAAIIRDDTHRYTPAMMSDRAVTKLALFVSRGQIDADKYIDRTTKTAKGDVANGARFFQTVCAVCHGYDGAGINFRSAKNPEYVGTVATENPWEALHKIRFGQPGVGMVALNALDIQILVDILAYTQALPTK